MRIKKIALLALGVLACTACTTVGRKIDTTAVQQIEVGKTTRQEVRAKLGSPDQQITHNSDLIYVYTYAHSEAEPQNYIPYVGGLFAGTKTQNQSVTVTFSGDGIVRDVQSTMGGIESGSNFNAAKKAPIPDTDADKRPK